MALTAYERETTVSMNDEDEFALVTTHQRTVITKLRNNGAAEETGKDSFGGTSFRIPKKLVTFRNVRGQSKAPRKPMSEEARKVAAERMANARAARKKEGNE